MKVYLSKSNKSNYILVNKIRYDIEKEIGNEVDEYNGDNYSPKKLLSADKLVVILPHHYSKTNNIGRGQYEEILSYITEHSNENVYIINNEDCYIMKVVNAKKLNNPPDWNHYATLKLENTNYLVSDIAKIMSNKKEENKMKNQAMSSMKKRIMAQFMPVIAEDLGMSFDGQICVYKGDDAISINANNELTNYPAEMSIKCGLFLVSKPLAQVIAGDIVKVNNSYGKVIEVKTDKKELKVLSYNGCKSTKVTAKDGLLNVNNVQVVLNAFGGGDIGGMNPMMLMMLMSEDKGEKSPMNKMLPFMMMMQQGGQNTPLGSMNPMMMAMMMGDGDVDPMMMMMMMGGMPGMQQMIPQAPATTQTTVKQTPDKDK